MVEVYCVFTKTIIGFRSYLYYYLSRLTHRFCNLCLTLCLSVRSKLEPTGLKCCLSIGYLARLHQCTGYIQYHYSLFLLRLYVNVKLVMSSGEAFYKIYIYKFYNYVGLFMVIYGYLLCTLLYISYCIFHFYTINSYHYHYYFLWKYFSNGCGFD